MKSIKISVARMTPVRISMLALSALAYGLLLSTSHNAGYDLSSWVNVGYVVCLGLLALLALSKLPLRISGYFVALCVAATLYLAWPQTAAWRLQHTPTLTTEAERANVDFILTLDAVKRAYTPAAK
ncbi:hypothetical protein R70006_04931 [Paraburkholderia domus]|uniref:hypothetical protein n=1 Tax=Paraburkholderia domus TaxID=2793075 RepID=UPI001913A3EC|nr:hypothetical protein [Paraburkholderia domus]MBK5051830.1 hypothetical protein [Burkholderia sp. R-70006]CAE6792931.1 hypothetical protein R70006_04931 [Paraburkholderia domus]